MSRVRVIRQASNGFTPLTVEFDKFDSTSLIPLMQKEADCRGADFREADLWGACFWGKKKKYSPFRLLG